MEILKTSTPTSPLSGQSVGNWMKYPDFKPPEIGLYLVYRPSCGKTHFQRYNGTGFAYDDNTIKWWAIVKLPELFTSGEITEKELIKKGRNSKKKRKKIANHELLNSWYGMLPFLALKKIFFIDLFSYIGEDGDQTLLEDKLQELRLDWDKKKLIDKFLIYKELEQEFYSYTRIKNLCIQHK